MWSYNKLVIFLFSATVLLSCGSKKSVAGKVYKKQAKVSYYADKFNGRTTASGEKFNNNKLTAAHRTFPFGTKLKVTNQKNNKSVTVTVNDRGPFIKTRELDLSKEAFMQIAENKNQGILTVTIELIK